MFKTIKKQTRSNKSIPFFYEVNPNHKIIGKHMKEHYYDTGKIIRYSRELSDDHLTVIIRTDYREYESFKEVISDPFCEKYIFVPNTLYDIENEITSDNQYIKE